MFWQILHYYGGIQIQAMLVENDAMPRIFLDYCIPDDPSLLTYTVRGQNLKSQSRAFTLPI